MTFNKPLKYALAAISSAVLIACGGGGDDAPKENLTIQGTAAKGILIGAKVQVYEINDLNLENPLDLEEEVTTMEDGSFRIKLKSGEGPFIIKVEAVENSTYLDETTIDPTTKDFKSRPAKPGLVLTTFVETKDINQPIVANPYTHVATKIIQLYGVEAIEKAKEIAINLAGGVNPFSTKPIGRLQDLKQANPDSIKLLASLIGFSKLASGCQSLAAASDIQCFLEKFVENIQESVSSNDPELINNFIKEQLSEAENHINAEYLDAIKSISSDYLTSIEKIDYTYPIFNKDDFPKIPLNENTFFRGLQTKFAEPDSLMKVVSNDMVDNYGYLTSVGTYTVVAQAYSFYEDCKINNAAQISCTGNTWTVDPSKTNTAQRTSSKTNELITVKALGDINGKRSATIEGARTDGKKKSSLDMTISYIPVNDWASNEKSEVEINSTFTALNNDDFATIKLNGKLTSTATEGLNFNGTSTVNTSNGDTFTNGVIQSNLSINDDHSEFKLNNFTFTADANIEGITSAVVPKLLISGDYTPASFNNTTFDAFAIDAELSVGTDSYKLSAVRDSADQASVTAKFYNLVATLNATPSSNGKYCVSIQSDEKLCADTLNIASSNGQYEFKNFDLKEFSATIYEGNKQIGSMNNGKIKVNGKEFSIR